MVTIGDRRILVRPRAFTTCTPENITFVVLDMVAVIKNIIFESGSGLNIQVFFSSRENDYEIVAFVK